MVDFLKLKGTNRQREERLKMSVKSPASWNAHARSTFIFCTVFFISTGLHSIYHVPYATLSIFIIIIIFFFFLHVPICIFVIVAFVYV